MNSTEIENLRVEKLKEINAMRENLNTAQIRKHELERELCEIGEAIRFAKHVLSVKKTEVDVLTSQYWQSKS